MARRNRLMPATFVEPEPDTRPTGSVLFADPSTAEFPRQIHAFNDPRGNNSHGEQNGVRTMTGRLVPWNDRQSETTGEGLWANMNRKRGVKDDDECDG